MSQIAWVTGGSSGIGEAVVNRLHEAGSRVCVLDLVRPTVPVPWVGVDFGDPLRVLAAIDELVASEGWPQQLVLCAGVPGRTNAVADYPLDLWSAVLAINLTGPLLVLRRVLPVMCDRGFGRIVSVSSGTAIRPRAGTAAYASSKAGLIALTKVVAMEGAPHGVTANVVAPGITNTPMVREAFGGAAAVETMATNSAISNPQGSVLQPEDVADAIVYLCSEGSQRITGQVLHVNGGSIMP